MKFVRDNLSAITVRQVERGSIRVGQDQYTEHVVLHRDSVTTGWMADQVGKLEAADFDAILEDGPEIVILGTGWTARMPPRELIFAMARRRVGFEFMDTPAACRTFNILVSEDRDVAAVLLMD